MRLLLVAATLPEIAPLANLLGPLSTGLTHHSRAGHQIDALVTGVGMVATATGVAHALATADYDAALNLGICGSFDRAIPLGGVVHIISDGLPELGAEDGEHFIPAPSLGLLEANVPPFSDGLLVNAMPPLWPVLRDLPRVAGVTVNTVHGHEPSIAALRARVHAEVESMEGAAFFFACLTAGVPCAQVRAVSNYVERRNRAAWRIGDAIEALNDTARAILEAL